MNRTPALVALALAAAAVAGCADKEGKPVYAPVSGTVTLNGQAVEKGTIMFNPVGKPGTSMDIVNGKFSGEALTGENKIAVSVKKKSSFAPPKLPKHAETIMKGYAERGGDFGVHHPDFDPSMVEQVPTEWQNTQTRLVEAGAANEFKFDITGTAKEKKVVYQGK